MSIIFIILTICVHELLFNIALHQQMGISPNVLGSSFFCALIRIPLLITSIWYFGWLWGIIIFVCGFLSLLHVTIGWLINIPTLFFKHEEQMIKSARTEVALLAPTFLVSTIFCVISFFVVEYKDLYYVIADSDSLIFVIIALLLISSIARIIVSKIIQENIKR